MATTHITYSVVHGIGATLTHYPDENIPGGRRGGPAPDFDCGHSHKSLAAAMRCQRALWASRSAAWHNSRILARQNGTWRWLSMDERRVLCGEVSPPENPVTIGGWYRLCDGRVAEFRWHGGQCVRVREADSYADIPGPEDLVPPQEFLDKISRSR